MTERQKYQVLQKYDDFEVRMYEPCVVAEVTIDDDYSAAASRAFGPLFSYISKGNSTSKSIAMTAPVISVGDENVISNHWKVHFVMPDGSRLEDLPLPNDSRVVLRQLPAEKCVALSFRGRATKKLCERKEDELRLQAKREHFTLSKEVRVGRFDPPFKPGFVHYNEIAIPIE